MVLKIVPRDCGFNFIFNINRCTGAGVAGVYQSVSCSECCTVCCRVCCSEDDVRAQGLLVCAPGYSGETCEIAFCAGVVNITWPTADIA